MPYYKEEQLNQLAADFVRREYGIGQLVPVEISARMSTKLGVFITKNNRAHRIRLSKNLLEYYGDETVRDVLYHECVHYALFVLKLPYRDGSAYFEEELKRLGIQASRSYPYKGAVHIYKCPRCRVSFGKKMKGYEKRYICSRCRGKYVYAGRKMV